MTEYEKHINRAMNEVKNKYAHECIFSGHFCETIVGAHIFKRAGFPERAAWPENIFPLSEDNDKLLEKVQDPWKRIAIIIAKTSPCFESMVMLQLKKLVNLVLEEDHSGKGLLA